MLAVVEKESADERIGRQVAFLRGVRDVSQTALAEAMKARGHQKWSQSTVWAVEKGTRPLRLTEALDVAYVLGVLVDDLVEPREGEARYQQEIERAKAELEAVRRVVENRIERLDHDSLVDIFKKGQRRWEAKERDDG